MASAAEVRAWGQAHGRPTTRGKLGRDLIDAWDLDHPHDPYEPGGGHTAVNGHEPMTLDDDGFEGMFPEPGDGPSDGDLRDTGETPPRKPVKRATAKKPGRWGFGKPKTGAKRKQPRVSTEDLLGSLWRAGAKLAAPLPPLQRTLRLQAPVAGLLLEDVVKDTAADLILQPFARLASQGKTLQALAGPPVFVTAIMAHQMQMAAQDKQPNPLFMTVATEGLRSSLMAWMDVAGPKFEIAMQREAEFEAKYGQTVDATIALIFSGPVDPADMDAVQAEDEAIRRAQGIL